MLQSFANRLMPKGENQLLLAGNAIILTAIGSVLLNQGGRLMGERLIAVMALLVMFGLSLGNREIEQRLGITTAGRVIIFANSGLFLIANWFGIGTGFQFLPFVLFMLSTQAVVEFGTLRGIIYSVGIALLWSGQIWLLGSSFSSVLINFVSIGLGMIFSCTFAIVIVRYAQATEQANRLLEQLRLANQELEQAQVREKEFAAAEERVRLARDIHDGLGHHLTALHVQLQTATKLLERDPKRAAEAISMAQEVAQAALSETRRSVSAMRQSPLDGRSLPNALALLVSEFEQRHAIPTTLEIGDPSLELPTTAAISLYRAAQEGLTNAHKHGDPSQISLRLTNANQAIQLTVHNDRAAPAQPALSGFGLVGLRERANQLGGQLEANYANDGGFVLRMHIPHQTQSEGRPH